MSDSDKRVLMLLIGGVGYALLKLGDKLVRVVDELGYFIVGIDELVQGVVNNSSLDLGSLVLILAAIFLIIAIVDYITTH